MRVLKIATLPSVKEAWQDRDRIMLHGCFQLLIDFVEKEDGLNHCNYEFHKETVDELKYLYDWWKEYIELLIIDEDVEQEHLLRLVKQRTFMWT